VRIPAPPRCSRRRSDIAAITDARRAGATAASARSRWQSGEHVSARPWPAGRGQGDEALKVQRQGDDGDDRAGSGRGAESAADDEGKEAQAAGERFNRAAADQPGSRQSCGRDLGAGAGLSTNDRGRTQGRDLRGRRGDGDCALRSEGAISAETGGNRATDMRRVGIHRRHRQGDDVRSLYRRGSGAVDLGMTRSSAWPPLDD